MSVSWVEPSLERAERKLQWDYTKFPAILAQVANAYDVDLTRASCCVVDGRKHDLTEVLACRSTSRPTVWEQEHRGTCSWPTLTFLPA